MGDERGVRGEGLLQIVANGELEKVKKFSEFVN